MAVTWCTVDDVTDAIGVPATDTEHLQRCVDAANAFGFRRRAEAGYTDTEAEAPGPDALLGVITYAVTLYRERGTVDSYASFDAYAAGAIPQATHGQVLRLLGVPRPAIDRPLTDAELAVRRRARRRAAMLSWGAVR